MDLIWNVIYTQDRRNDAGFLKRFLEITKVLENLLAFSEQTI